MDAVLVELTVFHEADHDYPQSETFAQTTKRFTNVMAAPAGMDTDAGF